MLDAIASRAREVRSDRPQGKALKIVPILGPSHAEPAYELLRQQTLPSVLVSEVSQAGSVPELQVGNNLDVRVFLMDGQELVGAKQNRILNTDVLVPAHSTIKIPVSCVEQGRWHHDSPTFSSGKSASHRTRSAKLARVHQSLRDEQRHDANQGAVWEEVAQCVADSGAASPTGALKDAYQQRQQDLTLFRTSLQLPAEAVGLAVFHGSRFMGLDVFDRHCTLKYFWESLVDSYAIDLLAAPVDPATAESDEGQAIRTVLDRAVVGNWEAFTPPGEGKEWRLDEPQLSGAALVWEDQVVLHLQLFGREAQAGPAYRPRIRRPYMRPR